MTMKMTNGAPGNFEGRGSFDLLGANARTVTKARSEKNYEGEDQQGHHPADDEQENVQSIHAGCEGGGLLRP
jgi:hypothetical protein